MKVAFIYDPKGEFATKIDEFSREAQRRYPDFRPETISTDSREAAELASTYDITSYPAIMVRKDDGQLVQMWQGSSLPRIDDIIGYLV